MDSYPSLDASDYYPISRYWRAFLTALILFSAGLFLFFTFISSTPDKNSTIIIWARSIIILVACFVLYFIYATRLIITSRGIREYQPYPFYKEIKWEEVDKVRIHESGSINLLYRKKGKYRKNSGLTLPYLYHPM